MLEQFHLTKTSQTPKASLVSKRAAAATRTCVTASAAETGNCPYESNESNYLSDRSQSKPQGKTNPLHLLEIIAGERCLK